MRGTRIKSLSVMKHPVIDAHDPQVLPEVPVCGLPCAQSLLVCQFLCQRVCANLGPLELLLRQGHLAPQCLERRLRNAAIRLVQEAVVPCFDLLDLCGNDGHKA